MKYKKNNTLELLSIVTIFFLAFLPRFMAADLFVNIDGSARWFARSEAFMRAAFGGNFSQTLIKGHPGVTLMWLSGSSMALKNLLIGQQVFDFSNKLGLLMAAKLPIIFITSLTIVLIYLMINRLTKNKGLAFLTAVFLLIDPLFLAHSRFFQMDALMAVFIILSLLFFLLFLERRNKFYLLFSGIAAGLAFLTKTPSFVLIPSFFIIVVLDSYIKKYSWRESVKILLFWFFIAFLTFFVFYPACWTIPGKTLKTIVVDGILIPLLFKHEVPNLMVASQFIEKLYPALYLITNLTLLVIAAFIIGLICFFRALRKNGLRALDLIHRNMLYLLVFIFNFCLVMFLAAKQFGRYQLPMFLGIDIFCAISLYIFISKIKKKTNFKRHFLYGILVFIFLTQALFVFMNYPYYSAYTNVLFPVLNRGSLSTSNAFSLGWGEGLEQAAEYLNQKENPENLIVASWYEDSLQVFFKGVVTPLPNWEESDYIVLYQNQVHRGIYPDLIEKTLGNENIKPEKIINISGYDYAWVYKTDEIRQ